VVEPAELLRELVDEPHGRVARALRELLDEALRRRVVRKHRAADGFAHDVKCVILGRALTRPRRRPHE
jgi:hypothetical protein